MSSASPRQMVLAYIRKQTELPWGVSHGSKPVYSSPLQPLLQFLLLDSSLELLLRLPFMLDYNCELK